MDDGSRVLTAILCHVNCHFFLGAGGGEASVFAQQIFDMYLKYAASMGFSVASIDIEIPPGTNVGIQVHFDIHVTTLPIL